MEGMRKGEEENLTITIISDTYRALLTKSGSAMKVNNGSLAGDNCVLTALHEQIIWKIRFSLSGQGGKAHTGSIFRNTLKS